MSTILVVDSLPIVRAGWRAILHSMNDTTIVHELPLLPDRLGDLPVSLDLVILDVESTSVPETTLPLLVSQLRRHVAQAPILLFGGHNTQLLVSIAMQHGADGYLTRFSDEKTIIATLHTLLNGMQCFPRSQTISDLAEKIRQLSHREMEVLVLLHQGLRNKDAARRLFLSEKTISTHKQNILTKLGLRTLSQIGDHELPRSSRSDNPQKP